MIINKQTCYVYALLALLFSPSAIGVIADSCNITKTAHNQKTIIVTGGAGFLGSHLCEQLVNQNHHVICIDNLLTGSLNNISNLVNNTHFKFIQHDITQPLPIKESEGPIDEIYNLACPASPVHYQEKPVNTIKTSVLGIINVLELAYKHNAKVFQASTSEIYGDPLQHPQQETYWGNVNPIGIRSCYDEGKRCAETLCMDYHRSYGVSIKIGRIFNTYGPRMSYNDGRVISNFIIQALNNKPITIYGNGEQTRSFCYVDDLIDVIIRFMESDNTIIGPINIGNPHEFTIKELANTIITLTGSTSQIISLPLPQDDPSRRRPDISLAQYYLDWMPHVQLNEGLGKTIDYFKQTLTH